MRDNMILHAAEREVIHIWRAPSPNTCALARLSSFLQHTLWFRLGSSKTPSLERPCSTNKARVTGASEEGVIFNLRRVYAISFF